MADNGNHFASFVLTLLAIIFNSFTCLISIIILICILKHQYSTRIKRQDRIILILSANIYFYMFIFGIIQLLLNTCTLLGDLYEINFDSPWCTFNGFVFTGLQSALYYGFVAQGFFRLCRIVYSSYRWLQLFWFYVILIPIQLVGVFILLCPLLVWHDLIYLPNEYYCFVLLTNVRGTLWIMLHVFGIPMLLLLFMYLRIIVFIRQQPINQSLVIKRQQQRDLLAIQRIFITISLLSAVATPAMVLVIMAYITRVEQPLTHRLTMISYAMSMAVLSAEMVFVTPQLKLLISRIWKRNRVVPVDANLIASIQMRPIATIA